MDIYVKLATDTIKDYLLKEKLPDIKTLPAELQTKRAGCFVSLHTKSDDKLRGCIGTILPTHKNIAGEIIANAIEASFNDPRFEPLKKDELDNLDVSVDVLGTPEFIDNEKDLDVKKYGVIVKVNDGRTGLLLPDIEGVNTVKEQIEIAKDKGGITPDDEVLLYRFTVTRHQ